MSNMSYCRFQNTLQDFRDCQKTIYNMIEAPEECGPLSKAELEAAKDLAKAALELLDVLADYSHHTVDELVEHPSRLEAAVNIINEEVQAAERISEQMMQDANDDAE